MGRVRARASKATINKDVSVRTRRAPRRSAAGVERVELDRLCRFDYCNAIDDVFRYQADSLATWLREDVVVGEVASIANIEDKSEFYFAR